MLGTEQGHQVADSCQEIRGVNKARANRGLVGQETYPAARQQFPFMLHEHFQTGDNGPRRSRHDGISAATGGMQN
jgi:hypothetical protein